MHSPITRVALLATALLIAGCQTSGGSAPQKENLTTEQILERRAEIEEIAQGALEKLYADKPETKDEIRKAAGYGIFNVTTVNALLVVGSTGPGVIIDNKTQHRTFMRALRAGTGPGVGYQELYQIFVFKNAAALEQFKVGGKVGGDVSASVTAGTAGTQYSFNPSITVYQLSEKGFALQANWGGTGYVLDPDLN